MVRLSVFAIIFLFCCDVAIAETIQLKSGREVKGKIIDRTKEYIKAELEGAGMTVTYYLDEIESINGQKILLEPEPIPQPQVTDQRQDDSTSLGTGASDAVSKGDVVKEKDERKEIADYFSSMGTILISHANKEEETSGIMENAKSKEQKQQAILQSINDIKETVTGIEALATPLNCQHYKELNLKAMQNQLEAQNLYFKMAEVSVIDEVKMRVQAEKLWEESDSWFAQAREEFNQIIQKYNISVRKQN